MVLPSSGYISSTQILAELGESAPLIVPSASVRTLTGKSSGAILWPDDFYGKSLNNWTVSTNPSSFIEGDIEGNNSATFFANAIISGNNTPVDAYSWGVSSIDQGILTIVSGGSTNRAQLKIQIQNIFTDDFANGVFYCDITENGTTKRALLSAQYYNLGENAGCVTADTYLPGFGLAGDVEVGDQLQIADPETFKIDYATVSRADLMEEYCVLITTEGGTKLKCSVTAPIATENGLAVLSVDLLNFTIPVLDEGVWKYEKVVDVEDIGVQSIVFITCENNFFLAGMENGRYMLHHNRKANT